MNKRLVERGTEVTWVSARDIEEQEFGQIGVPKDELLHEHVLHIDGWSTSWTQFFMRVPRDAIASLQAKMGFDDLASTTMKEAPRIVELPAPGAVVVLNVPDYPDPDGVSLVITLEDGLRFLSHAIATAQEAERAMKREVRLSTRNSRDLILKKARERERETTSCAADGCSRSRKFFDEKGIGFCGRHAEERGIRPKGKVQ